MIYPKDIMKEIIYTEENIRKVADELAKQINKDYIDKDLTLFGLKELYYLNKE